MGKKLSDLEVGARIKFGKYSVEGEEPHDIIWVKVHSDNTFMTERIEDFRAFDAKEPNNPDRYRRDYGNNDYTVSNIAQFLNSSCKVWFDSQHEYDEAPSTETTNDNTPYNNHQGFLSLFTDEEYEAIKYTEVITAVPNKGKTSIEQKVFLPSITNIYGYSNGNDEIMEGEYWDYFNTLGKSKRAMPTDYAVWNTTCSGFTINHNESWYYFMRSAQCSNSCRVRCVSVGGSCDYCNACQGVVGVRPALKLNPNILISDSDNDGFVILELPKVRKIEFSTEEVLNILNI